VAVQCQTQAGLGINLNVMISYYQLPSTINVISSTLSYTPPAITSITFDDRAVTLDSAVVPSVYRFSTSSQPTATINGMICILYHLSV
jgi:hypothetical protein